MKYAIVPLLFAVLTVEVTPAQTAGLRVENAAVSSSKFGSNDTLGGGGQCDSSGNIYIRVFDPATSHQIRPVLMFDKTGALQMKFVSPHLAQLQKKSGFEIAFAVRPHGGIAVADWNYPDIQVVEFSPDGKAESDVQLDFARFLPYQLAVFPSGELLLSGMEDGNGSQPHYRSYAAIYDKTGHLIKRLRLDGDEEIDRAIELGDSRYTNSGPNSGNFAAAFGMAAMGEDGNAYLVRRRSPAIVYVISSAGDVIRKLVVEPPTSGDVPFEMQPAKGQLAFVFDGWSGSRSSGNPKLTVVDARNGDPLDTFEGGIAGLGFLGLTCYAPDSTGFTFAGMSNAKHVEITTARKK